MRFCAIERILLLAILVAAPIFGTSQTAETLAQWHARALKENPPGVILQIVTLGRNAKDRQATYRVNDGIALLLLFSSSRARAYTVERATHGDDELVVQREGSTGPPGRLKLDIHVACCTYDRRAIGPPQKPTVTTLPLNVRFKPGHYAFFIRTYRVMDALPKRHERVDTLVVTSNIAHITIVPN